MSCFIPNAAHVTIVFSILLLVLLVGNPVDLPGGMRLRVFFMSIGLGSRRMLTLTSVARPCRSRSV